MFCDDNIDMNLFNISSPYPHFLQISNEHDLVIESLLSFKYFSPYTQLLFLSLFCLKFTVVLFSLFPESHSFDFLPFLNPFVLLFSFLFLFSIFQVGKTIELMF